MKAESRQFICKIGKVLICKDGYTWVYVGYRKTRVNTFEHHFSRSDYIPETGAWTYRAVQNKTIRDKFPDLKIGLNYE